MVTAREVRVRVSWTLLTFAFVSGLPAHAQRRPEPSPPAQDADATGSVDVGARVRIRTTTPATLTGEVVAIDQDRFVLRLDGRVHEVTIPRSAVAVVERSQGRIRVGSPLKSALKGLALGAAAGWLLGEAFPTCRVGGTDPFCDATSGPTDGRAKDKSNQFAAWFGAVGAAAGGLVGSRRVEQWKGASVEAPLSKPVAIAVRGLGASIRISF